MSYLLFPCFPQKEGERGSSFMAVVFFVFKVGGESHEVKTKGPPIKKLNTALGLCCTLDQFCIQHPNCSVIQRCGRPKSVAAMRTAK